MRKLSKIITAFSAAIATAAAFCTTAFAASPLGTLVRYEYSYEYNMSPEEMAQLMSSMMNGFMWYFIIGTGLGLIAVVVGIIVIVRYKSNQKQQMYSQGNNNYPPQY